MIITQTPLRISFFGGGTDFRDFFAAEPGGVLSTTIDKCIYVTISERWDDKIRVGYTRTELVDDLDELDHSLVRECLRKTGIRKKVEVNTMADIPTEGSGLGSSSAVTVGLLNAMYAYLGKYRDPESLAQEACEIEIDVLKKPIGIQDQYIAAYGGLRNLEFLGTSSSGRAIIDQVSTEQVQIDPLILRRLNQNLMLFYTNVPRKAETVLAEQKDNIEEKRATLRAMHEMALEGKKLLEKGCIDDFGELLHVAWEMKKRLASKISNDFIDGLYEKAREAGARGGKIAGAGGGGFLMLYCNRDKQERVREVMQQLPELPFHLERDGSKVIFNYRR